MGKKIAVEQYYLLLVLIRSKKLKKLCVYVWIKQKQVW